jgi:integrase
LITLIFIKYYTYFVNIFKIKQGGNIMYQRNGMCYTDYYNSNGRRQRVSLKTKDPEIAKQKEEALKRGPALPDTQNAAPLSTVAPTIPAIPAPPTITWRDFKDKYAAFLRAERSEGTADYIETAIRYLEELKDIKYLAEITPDLLQKLKQWIAQRYGTGNAGVNRYIRALKTMMRWAERKKGDNGQKLIQPQDWLEVSKLKEGKGRLIFYAEEEVKRLLGAARGVWKMVVRLGARAGLRRGEIANLQWQDVDFANNQLFIAPNKTDKSRYIPMSGDLRQALQEYPKDSDSPYVINLKGRPDNLKRGKKFLGVMSSYYSKIRKRAGLGKKGCLHTLRHTFASHLVQNGVDLYTVSKLLGHSSIKMTEIYAHLSTKTFQDAIDKLPQI